MRNQKRKTSHVVRDDDGNTVDVSKALLDAIAEESGDESPDSITIDSLIETPDEGSKQTGEMKVLVRMAKKGKFTPRTEYEMGACQMLKFRGYATTEDNKRFSPTPQGVARAKEMNLSLRLGRR